MSDVAIRLRALTKAYRLYKNSSNRAFGIFNIRLGRLGVYTEHLAIDGIDLEIRRGERVGIIGRNGSGKSTLLKLISGTTAPTSGAREVHGDIHVLMNLGTGFHPDFTGRENAHAYLAQMGVSGPRADSLVAELAAFAELGQYFDQPLSTYSSGMAVRLMFAASTAIKPDILLLDEVLGVGDAYFVHKSFNRLRALCTGEGTTLLLVTHSPHTAAEICKRMIWLDAARIMADGEPLSVINAYEASIRDQEEQRLRQLNEYLASQRSPAESLDVLWAPPPGEEKPCETQARSVERRRAKTGPIVIQTSDLPASAHVVVEAIEAVPDGLPEGVVPLPIDWANAAFSETMKQNGSGRFPLEIETPPQPWAYGAVLPFRAEDAANCGLVRLRARVLEGRVGFGILNHGQDDFIYRSLVSASSDPVTVMLPIAETAEAALGKVVRPGAAQPGPVDEPGSNAAVALSAQLQTVADQVPRGRLFISRVRLLAAGREMAVLDFDSPDRNPSAWIVDDRTTGDWGPAVRHEGRLARQYMRYGSIFHKLPFMLSSASLDWTATDLAAEVTYWTDVAEQLTFSLFHPRGNDRSFGTIDLALVNGWAETHAQLAAGPSVEADTRGRYGTRRIEITDFGIYNGRQDETTLFDIGETMRIRLNYRVNDPSLAERPTFMIGFHKDGLLCTHRLWTEGFRVCASENPRGYIDAIASPLLLGPGQYTVSVLVFQEGHILSPGLIPYFTMSKYLHDTHARARIVEIRRRRSNSPVYYDFIFQHPSRWICNGSAEAISMFIGEEQQVVTDDRIYVAR